MKPIIPLLCSLLLLAGCDKSNSQTMNPSTTSTPGEVAVLETKFGKIVVEFAEQEAPKTTENFKKLAKSGFYNGTTFHRVIPNFMIQGGDPNTKSDPHSPRAGTGGPGYTVPAEIKLPNKRGALACARTGNNVNPTKASSGSQFFINVKDNDFLDDPNQGGYTVFGRVVKGMEVADQIVNTPRDGRDNPNDPVKMEIKIVSRAEAGL